MQGFEIDVESRSNNDELSYNDLYCSDCDVYMEVNSIRVDFAHETLNARGECYLCGEESIASVKPTEYSQYATFELN